MNGLQLNVYLMIDTSQILIPIVPPEQFPVKPIGHFVFIDAIFTVQNSSTPNLLLSLATSSAIAMYKYSSVYYNSDGLPFPEANPCATRSVDVFSDNQNIDEYANMTSKSHICCTSWLPIAQNSTTTSEQTTTETSNTKLTTTETPAKKQTQSYIWLIILCTVIALIALISITVLIIRYRKKKHQARIEDLEIAMQKLSNFPNYNTPEASKKDPYLIDENKLHVDFKKTIGKGCSATVYQAHLEGPSPLYLTHKSIQAQQFQDCNVAIKIAGSYGNNEDEMLLQEIETMKRLGYQEHIIAMLGMQYIAWKQMAHRDLAARNILLTDSYKAKIADFGLCCTFDDSLTYQASRQKKLPMKWLSIEAISKRQFSEKSDVWSFGVLMYEIFSGGKVPYTTMSNDEMLEFLQEGNRLSCPEETPEEVYEIMLQCWNQEPVNRPTFEEMVEKFRNMLNMVTGSDGYLS
uniref:Protein kinase domain-containing protein n=1 Tax=Acrobeloides nanus TaxID=290746 RepID=A0A914E0H7_9BILA